MRSGPPSILRRSSVARLVRGAGRRLTPAVLGLGGLLLVLGPLASRGADFPATLDRPTIEFGETATLSLSFSGDSPQQPPSIPPVPGLTCTYRGASQQLQIVNGRTTRSVVLSYEVAATQPGTYTIPAIPVTLSGRVLRSNPLTLSVVRSQTAFLTLAPPSRPLYVGESVPVEVHLFATGGNVLQAPRLHGDGVIVGTNFPVSSPVQVQTNGALWARLTWRGAVSLVKSGTLDLAATDCVLEVRIRRAAARRDPFGFDFGDFFSDLERRRLTLSSERTPIVVQPLPPGAPPGFNGAVGDFTLAASVSTNVVAAGDPVSLTLRLSGTGPIETLKLEAPSDGADLKTYTPTTRVDLSDDLGLRGTKTFEYVVIPESPAVREIPPVRFSFFDPVQKAYRTVASAALPLTVQAVAHPVTQSPGTSTPDPRRPENRAANDIVHIKPRAGTLAAAQPPLLVRPWFLALNLLPLALWGGAVAWRRRRDHLAAHPRLRRRQAVARTVQSGLQQLRTLAAANRGEEFFSTLFRLLQEQVGERLDLPASAITAETLETRLQPAGVDTGTLERTEALFQLCDQARYAPLRSAQELQALLPRIEETFRRLQSVELDRSTPRLQPPVALWLAGALLAASSPGEAAAEAPAAFAQGNRAYEQGRFDEAVAAYESLLQSGAASPAAFFNLGNAHFRAGRLGLAILHYCEASALDPRDPDIQANLRFARQAVAGGGPPREPRWRRGIRWLTLNEWTTWAALAAWLLLGTLSLRQALPKPPRALRWITGGLLAALIPLGLATAASWQLHRTDLTAIVVRPEASARYGPLEESQTHFIARDGAELPVLDRQGPWVQVIDPARRIGWVRSDEVRFFPDPRP